MAEFAPQKPYAGDESYIFISYAHRDRGEVLPVIARMQRDGYRVWYDEGIDPGTEWDENIAVHVENCTVFLAFLSEAYLDSDNCRDELNYARDLKKSRLLIYLRDVTLPSGMAMRLNRLQAIHRYAYTEEEEFYEKLYSAPEPAVCRSERTDELSGICKSFAERREGYLFVHLMTYDYHERARFHTTLAELLPEGAAFVRIDDFINELIESIVHAGQKEFRRKYTEAGFLILEDFEITAGKSSTQEEIYRILRDRFYAGKPVLLLTGKPLDHRFGDDLTALIRCAKTIRIGGDGTEGRDVIRQILAASAELFGVTEEDLLGVGRRKEVQNARYAAMYTAWNAAELPLGEIANRFGREPSTVALNLKKHRETMENDETLLLRTELLVSKFRKKPEN